VSGSDPPPLQAIPSSTAVSLIGFGPMRVAAVLCRAAVAYHFLSEKIYKFREFPLPEDVEYVTPIVSGPAASGGVAEYGMRVDSWAEDMQAAIGLEAEIENLAATGAGVAGGARVVKQDR
jgi:hypothetical protein